MEDDETAYQNVVLKLQKHVRVCVRRMGARDDLRFYPLSLHVTPLLNGSRIDAKIYTRSRDCVMSASYADFIVQKVGMCNVWTFLREYLEGLRMMTENQVDALESFDNSFVPSRVALPPLDGANA